MEMERTDLRLVGPQLELGGFLATDVIEEEMKTLWRVKSLTTFFKVLKTLENVSAVLVCLELKRFL